jgi:hypothetical protein
MRRAHPPVFDLEHHHFADADGVVLVVQKQNVAALKRGLHGPGEHHHHGRLALGDEHEPFPNHERRKNNHG